VLAQLTSTLRQVAKSWGGGSDGSVGGLWSAIAAAGTHRSFFATPTSDSSASPGDYARRKLGHVLRVLDRSRQLIIDLAEKKVIPDLVLHVIEGQLDAADKAALAKLCVALDMLAGRKGRQGRAAG
jgi:hypothetical protein